MKATRAISAAIGAALTFAVTTSIAAAQTTIKYAIPYPTVEILPLYIAQEKGYFRDEKLALEVTSLASGDKITIALVSGSIDIAYYTPDWFIRAIEKDAKIKIILGGSNVPVYSLVVPKDLQAYGDLKGKRVAVSTIKASDAYLVRRMFAANGLKESDYVLIQAGAASERAAALKAGSVSATLVIPPFDQQLIDEGGYKRLDISSRLITHYTWGSQAAREDWAKANKGALVGFIRGWIKGVRFAYDPKNKDETVKLITRQLKMNERYAGIVYDMYLGSSVATLAKDGELDLVGLQELIKAMAAQGEPVQPGNAQKYLDFSYWNEARKSVQ